MKTSWFLYSFIIEIKNECGWDTIVLSWYLLQIDLFFKPFINHTFSINTIDSIQPATLVEAFFVITISDFFIWNAAEIKINAKLFMSTCEVTMQMLNFIRQTIL